MFDTLEFKFFAMYILFLKSHALVNFLLKVSQSLSHIKF